MNPSVLLKEHNMIQTLPPELKASGDAFRMTRQATGEVARLGKAFPGFKYGEGPRLSRHKIKALESKYLKKTDPSTKIFGNMQERYMQHRVSNPISDMFM